MIAKINRYSEAEYRIQDFIDFAIKLFYKFLIIIRSFHKILYDSDIPLS